MSFLIDSHILLWYDTEDPRLSSAAVEKLRESRASVYVSAATIWELAIKQSLGKLPIQGSITGIATRNNFQLLSVTPEHAEHVSGMKHLHGDPFDRLILAQAALQQLTLVTHDRTLLGYGVPILLV